MTGKILKFPVRPVCPERDGPHWKCGKTAGHEDDHEAYNAFLRKTYTWPNKPKEEGKPNES